MRALLRSLLTVCFAFSLASTAIADKRVALIVANGAYKGAPLENPTLDADLVSASLTNIGFTVRVAKNVDIGGFGGALIAFAEEAKGADVALFYFAGHGFTVNQGIKPVSVLMSTSVDVAASNEFALRAGGIPLDDIVGSLAGQAKATLIFVDACRNDPRVSRALGGKGRGFDRLDTVQGGSVFIGLSTRLGDTAQDGEAGKGSPFARAFAANIRTKGMRIDDAFRRLREEVKAATQGKQLPDVVQDDLPDGAIILSPANVGPTLQPTVQDMAAVDLCKQALNVAKTDFENDEAYRVYVRQAQLRGLSVDECRAAMGMGSLKSEGLRDMPVPDLCRKALNAASADWESDDADRDYVAETRFRGLSVDACRTTLGMIPLKEQELRQTSIPDLCRKALNSANSDWTDADGAGNFAKEARSRGLTVDGCRVAIGMNTLKEQQLGEMSTSDLCGRALASSRTDWDTNDASADYAKEARARGLAVDGCRTALGMPSLKEEEERPNPSAPSSKVLPLSRTETPEEPSSAALPSEVPSSFWDHNGSTVYLVANGASRKFYYEAPRSGMVAVGVKRGTLLFEGSKKGLQYVGTAYVFSKTCGASAYRVEGPVSADLTKVTLYGKAPHVDSNCQVTSYKDDTLIFTFQRQASK
jgi:hypothetical protein